MRLYSRNPMHIPRIEPVSDIRLGAWLLGCIFASWALVIGLYLGARAAIHLMQGLLS